VSLQRIDGSFAWFWRGDGEGSPPDVVIGRLRYQRVVAR